MEDATAALPSYYRVHASGQRLYDDGMNICPWCWGSQSVACIHCDDWGLVTDAVFTDWLRSKEDEPADQLPF